MTDHAELRRLAEDVIRIERSEDEPISAAWDLFDSAANPKAILALLDEIDRLRSRLEIDERTPHDGIACRDETIKVLDEKCDRLKVENERLLDELSACTEHPGGCGYWREAAKRRAEERDRLRAENDRLRQGMKGDYDIDAWLEWTREKDQIKAEIEALRRFAGEAYQVLGALDAPENVLDNASDAANGVPLRHETLLPFFVEDFEEPRNE